MNKLVPIFIAFLYDLIEYNGHFSPLAHKYIALLREAFPQDCDGVVNRIKRERQQRQAELESILAGSPEQRKKILRERITAAEAELAQLQPQEE